MYIRNIFIEGPDCSGKTTLIENIHKSTNYRYHLMDRSRMSQAIFSKLYERNLPDSDLLFEQELNNLSNLYIVLLPRKRVILNRFYERGDDKHDIESIADVYHAYEQFIEMYEKYPNVLVINTDMNNTQVALSLIEEYESKEEYDTIKEFVAVADNKESPFLCLSKKLSLDDLRQASDNGCMTFERERSYYNSILESFFDKFYNEIVGKNEYKKEQNQYSRRFIFTDDSCISCYHPLFRDNAVYIHAYMRSSNSAQIEHDYKFIELLSSKYHKLITSEFDVTFPDTIFLEFKFGSAHLA